MPDCIKKERNKRTNLSGSFGNNFQVDSCIFMYLKYLSTCKCFGFEGGEDFEFITRDNKRHYFQAKCGTKHETINKKDQFAQIKKALISFNETKFTDATYNVIFNYKSPFKTGPSFGTLNYESINFGHPDLADELKRYKENKNIKSTYALEDVNFHYLRYDEQNPSSYISQEISNFLMNNHISVGRDELESQWFTIIARNGTNDYYIDSGIMAGTVFNLIIKEKNLSKLIDALNEDLSFEDIDIVKRFFLDFFGANDLSFTESNNVRSAYFKFLISKKANDDFSNRREFAEQYSSSSPMPKYFDNFLTNLSDDKKKHLLNHIFKTYVFVILQNESDIKNIKGIFGYAD